MTIDYSKYDGCTEGPWYWEYNAGLHGKHHKQVLNAYWDDDGIDAYIDATTKGDCNLIEDAPLLLAHCKKQDAEVERLREALTSIRGWREIGNAHVVEDFLKQIEIIADKALEVQS